MRVDELTHEFVESAPNELIEGKLYVSIPYATVLHKCCCGCGDDVVTPLSPTEWRLTFDGETISLHPSLGNWGLRCQSHYWIQRSRVRWASHWSKQKIDAGRVADRRTKAKFFEAKADTESKAGSFAVDVPNAARSETLWNRVRRFWS